MPFYNMSAQFIATAPDKRFSAGSPVFPYYLFDKLDFIAFLVKSFLTAKLFGSYFRHVGPHYLA